MHESLLTVHHVNETGCLPHSFSRNSLPPFMKLIFSHTSCSLMKLSLFLPTLSLLWSSLSKLSPSSLWNYIFFSSFILNIFLLLCQNLFYFFSFLLFFPLLCQNPMRFHKSISIWKRGSSTESENEWAFCKNFVLLSHRYHPSSFDSSLHRVSPNYTSLPHIFLLSLSHIFWPLFFLL